MLPTGTVLFGGCREGAGEDLLRRIDGDAFIPHGGRSSFQIYDDRNVAHRVAAGPPTPTGSGRRERTSASWLVQGPACEGEERNPGGQPESSPMTSPRVALLGFSIECNRFAP